MSEIKTEHGIFTDLKDRDGNVIKTAQEYYEWWLEQNKIDICPPKTLEERLEEAEQENKLLKAQVEALNSTTDFHEELIAEMAMMLYA